LCYYLLMEYYSPLRFPGGKNNLYNFIYSVILDNRLLNGCYVEPYAGGAAIALRLLMENICEKVYINDISKPIYAFWYSVLNFNDYLCQMIEDTDITIDEWHRQRNIFFNQEKESILELGFATFFLNRTNFSGILQAGVLGGKKQNSRYKVDSRFKKQNLIPRIRQIKKFADRIILSRKDALIFLNEKARKLPEKTLIYLDPPYYYKGKKLYENYYGEKNHRDIANFLTKNIDLFWLVSYDNADEIIDMYKNIEYQRYNLRYTANRFKNGNEIMFFSPALEQQEISII